MKIVCVYKSGGDYDVSYVKALLTGLRMHTKYDFNFYCLTNEVEEVRPIAEPIPLKYDFPNWFCKMELFDPSIFNDDEVILYFDLDVLILKPIDALIDICHEVTQPIMVRDADKVAWDNNWPNTSIMSWKGRDMHDMWIIFKAMGMKNVERRLSYNPGRAGQRTDQGFIRLMMDTLKFQDYLSDDYIKFKYDYRNTPGNAFLETVTILNWTGHPRFHEMGSVDQKIRDIWESRKRK